jgi:YebC/PmpR family DNA-binding regulatory protein
MTQRAGKSFPGASAGEPTPSLRAAESPYTPACMSGHSKWHSIKHKKAVVDARRGQHFTKLARAISVAAREGGGDPDGNSALALAIQKARDASMPKDNIERAIAKGTGEGADGDQIETVLYEGYGPGGVALLIEAFTDNRNRTSADVRHAFTSHGGTLGEPGSVAYLFEKRGEIVVDAGRYDDDDLIGAIDAGAEDIVMDDDVYEILTAPGDLAKVQLALRESDVEIESADVVQRPSARVPVSEADATRLLKLIDMLEESDDVNAVHANFDVDAEVLERIAG